MVRKGSMFIAITLVLLVAVAPISSSIVQAQDEGIIIAEGLNGPMDVLVAPDGGIWVVDSGVGGDDEIETISPESGESVLASLGDSAVVVQIHPEDGSQTVAANLPSLATPEGAEGGGKLALVDGVLYVTSGAWIGAAMEEALPNTGAVLTVGEDGELTEIARAWEYERDENPDETILESHPYGITGGPDGMLYVADAAGNTLLLIDPDNGSVATLAIFEALPGVFPNPARGGELLTDPVPTDVVVGEDGTAYVSLLSGAPFIPGSAKVVAVAPDGTTTDYATGLTMLTDLTRGPDGNLYAVQFAIFSDQGPTPNSGAVVLVQEGDASKAVIEDLSFPTGVDFDADGNAYVAINGVGAPGSGAVVMYAAVASADEMAAAGTSEEAAADAEMAEEATADAEMAEEATADAEMAEEATADAEMAEEATADAEMAEEATADAEIAEEATADAEMAEEEMAAPASMPTTGAGIPSALTITLLGLLAMVGLGVATALRRRIA